MCRIFIQIYSGTWRDAVGTALFFEEVKPPPPADPVFSSVPAKMLQYLCKTRKTLEMSRVFINRKKKDVDEVQRESKDMCETECMKENKGNSGSQVVSLTILYRSCICLPTHVNNKFINIFVVDQVASNVTSLSSLLFKQTKMMAHLDYNFELMESKSIGDSDVIEESVVNIKS